ncbi:Glutamine--fructose-6-phosphate aminotransferase [isomerizing] [Geodia barretti]|uniref:Glutamine--fructose-6-phosphate aminotransferase [isomerizing] n=1 Tax=Geodia barretti TaxID=519541 RepID=A0AA35RS01_GEOBA|nr:Glutamine--fructose-6-phosphate aminotransferase [isomerizing] [Geodia barretti]
MCGIIGYIGRKPVVPVLIEGLRRLEYRGYDSAGVASSAGTPSSFGAAPASWTVWSKPSRTIRSTATTASATRGGRRTAGPPRGERAPPPGLHRAHRRRAQRHHRELPGAEARARGRGPPVRDGDRHRGRRPSRRVRMARGRARGGGPPGPRADTRAVRAGAAGDRRSAEAGGGSPGSADSGGRERGRLSRRVGRPRDSQPQPGRRVSRQPRDGRHHPRRRDLYRFHGCAGRRHHPAHQLGPGDGGEGRLPALHAEGDLRAAVGGPRNVRPGLPRRAGHPDRTAPGRHPRGHPGLRYVLARRPRGQVPDRAARDGAGGGGLRFRVPVPGPHRDADDAHGGHHAVRRDRRYARRASRGPRPRRRDHRHLQRRRQHGHPRGRFHRLHPRRTGDRGRVDQGVHLAARGPASAGPLSGPDPRDASGGGRAPAPGRPEPPAALARADPAMRGRREVGGATVPPAPELPVSRARHQLSDRPGGRAEAQGNLLHPRRGIPGGRDEARPDRPRRRADAGRDPAPGRLRLREDGVQPAAGQGARRPDHRGGRRPPAGPRGLDRFESGRTRHPYRRHPR